MSEKKYQTSIDSIEIGGVCKNCIVINLNFEYFMSMFLWNAIAAQLQSESTSAVDYLFPTPALCASLKWPFTFATLYICAPKKLRTFYCGCLYEKDSLPGQGKKAKWFQAFLKTFTWKIELGFSCAIENNGSSALEFGRNLIYRDRTLDTLVMFYVIINICLQIKKSPESMQFVSDWD